MVGTNLIETPPLENRNDYIIHKTKACRISEPDNGHKTDTLTKSDLKRQSERLKTFKNWKSDAITPEELAKAGFYFLNNPLNPDLVKCAFCKAEICRWEPGDKALEEHIKWSPNCPFAKDLRVRSSLVFLRSEQGEDVCGNAEVLPHSMPESETFRLLNTMCNKTYEEFKTRLESFEKWPKTLKQQPEALAEAGFYYRGVEDHTICFKCGGALRDWKDDDDPWEQHAMWFPLCKYLLSKKGKEYVAEVQSKLRSGVPANSTKDENEDTCGQGSASNENGIVTCTICNSNERNIIFRPCNHIVSCLNCAVMMDKCPICRKQIDERMKVFLS